IALNYGSRDEITRGVRELAELVKAGELEPDAIDEDAISKHLYTGKLGVPDPDLIIRPGGEVRLSNYLLWQVAYAEMYFCDTLWPDFTPDEYERILRSFGTRERRFGGRNE
ncbi:MAG: di-trans,poly-cis-decaprenylcistransferase, partial [Firmicutes bacterium]|nr:di-trans,poly-cis-decaprenylcistransferase [Bacillota bacterium]